MRRTRWAVAVLLAGAMGVSACGAQDRLTDDDGGAAASEGEATAAAQTVDFPLTIEDAYGNERTFDAPVTKLGMVEGNAPLALADLGVRPWADSNPRGVAKGLGSLFYPNGLAEHAGVNYEDPEAWNKTGVEVILAPGPAQPWNKPLRQTGKVFFLHHPDNEQSENGKGADVFKENLRLVGQIVDKPAEAEKAIARFDAFVAALKERAPEDAADNRILLLDETTDGTYYLASQPDGAFCRLLEENELGQCAVPPNWNERTWQLNAESVLAVNPDWIGYVRDVDETSWTERDDAVWKRLDAVKAGQVFDINGLWYGLRSAQWFLQLYGHEVWGDAAGIPAPGPSAEYVPTETPAG